MAIEASPIMKAKSTRTVSRTAKNRGTLWLRNQSVIGYEIVAINNANITGTKNEAEYLNPATIITVAANVSNTLNPDSRVTHFSICLDF